MENKFDVIIVGAGPAGIFTALEMLNNNSNMLLKEEIVLKTKPENVLAVPLVTLQRAFPEQERFLMESYLYQARLAAAFRILLDMEKFKK